MTRFELRERDLGEVIGLALQASTELFGQLFVLMVLTSLPALTLQLVLAPDIRPEQVNGQPPEVALRVFLDFMAVIGLIGVVQGLFAPFATGAAIHLVSAAFHGRQLGLLAAVRLAAPRYAGLLALQITLGVIQTLGAACTLYVLTVVSAVFFFVAAPALVLERLPWTECFARSRALTEGHRWEVLALLLVTTVAPYVVLMSAGTLLEVLAPGYYAKTLIGHLVGMAVLIVPLVSGPVVYYHLRVLKEAYDVERLAEWVDAIGAEPAPA